ncbi:MAG: VTT domain-containing protein [Rhodopseudomonas palustris]|nr:VTT domain-containing protein [Rhodopseudomonas palustris]
MTLAGRRAVRPASTGTVLVSFASSIGATLAFLASRFVLRDVGAAPLRRPARRRSTRAWPRDGAFYLFTLRLVPIFPFFVINLLMGLDADPGAHASTGSASSACWPARSST